MPNTLTQGLDVGRTILLARTERRDVIASLLDATGATLLFTGKVTGVRRKFRFFFAMGEVRGTRQEAP